MKTLTDGTEVTSRSYYFLLDFNDNDGWKTIRDLWDIDQLHKLDKHQYNYLFKKAIEKELELLK